MAILREKVSEIKSSFKLTSMDNLIADRFVASELKTTSFRLIKDEVNKRRLMASPSIFTTIPCLKMEPIPLAECCDYVSECNIARSIQSLPKLGESMYGVLVQGVFSVDRKVSFKQTDPNRYINLMKLYPNKKHDTYFWIGTDNHLYVTSEDIEIVRIIAFFEEDIDWTIYTCDSDVPSCNPNPLDLEFKCPGYLDMQVLEIVRNTILKTYKQSVADPVDDGKDESK